MMAITWHLKQIYTKKVLKAYFKLIRSLSPPPTPAISLHLFDHLVKPILLHGCEIWSAIDLKYKSTINQTAHDQ